MQIEFDNEQKVVLDLPKEKIGKGWRLVPSIEPIEVSNHYCTNIATIAFFRLTHLYGCIMLLVILYGKVSL